MKKIEIYETFVEESDTWRESEEQRDNSFKTPQIINYTFSLCTFFKMRTDGFVTETYTLWFIGVFHIHR